MFEKIGGKLKTFAVATFIVGCLASFVLGILLLATGDSDYTFSGLFLLLGGPLLNFVSVLPTYGFGELIDRATSIDNKLDKLIMETSEWKCENCGKTNPKDFKFCNHCGRAH